MLTHSIAGRSQAPKKVTVTDLFYFRGLDVGSVNIPYLLARYLRRFAAGRKSGAHISGGQFVGRLAQDFRLLTAYILGGLILDDTWAWVAIGPERQPDVVASTLAVAEDAPDVDEGDQAVLEDVHEIHGAMTEKHEGMCLINELFSDTVSEVRETEDWRGQHLRSTAGPTVARPMIPSILIFCSYLSAGSKFNTIVHDTKPSRTFTLNASMDKRDDFKCVEAEGKV
ncbi:hypothetical protein Tco_1281043 [Tanacetum coccineum]